MGRKPKQAPPAVRPVVGYVRVSSEGQAKEGASLAAQREAIEQWARAHGFPPPAVFEDAGLSGKDTDRPELRKALAAVCETKGALVCYSLSRLSRSVPDAYAIAERLREAGADLVSVTESIDTTTAMGKAFFGILAVLAQLERDQISERTKSVLGHMKANGKRVGTVPYGYRVGADGRTLEVEPTEAATVRLVQSLRRKGRKLREIAAELQRRGIRNRAGKDVWPLAVIHGLTQQPLPRTAKAR